MAWAVQRAVQGAYLHEAQEFLQRDKGYLTDPHATDVVKAWTSRIRETWPVFLAQLQRALESGEPLPSTRVTMLPTTLQP
jgi:hypothetical protein